MTIASLRIHGVVNGRQIATKWKEADDGTLAAKQLWGYVRQDATAHACLLGITANFSGHETFYIVAPNTMMETPSLELAQQFFPDTPVTGNLNGINGFFNCQKAERLLGWRHQE